PLRPVPHRDAPAARHGPARPPPDALPISGAVAIVALTQPDPPPTADSATTTTLVPPDSPTTTTEVLIRGQQLEFRTIELDAFPIDRKSTRLNSSHVKISYAVFCLKKENSS